MKVKLIVDGGKMQPGPAVAQQIGPLGINLGKLINDVNDATKGFSWMKVPVQIDVNSKTKSYDISVSSPTAAELIKKEINAGKGSGTPNSIKVGNIAFERIVAIADMKMPDLLARNLKSACKLVVGTCVSSGVMIDNKEATQIEHEIDAGKYNREIEGKIKEVPAEKKANLEKFFSVRKAKQEKDIKALEEAKAAKEAADAAAKAAAGTAVPAVVEGVKKEEPKKEEPKKEEKKDKKK